MNLFLRLSLISLSLGVSSCSPHAEKDFLKKDVYGNTILVDDRYKGSAHYPSDFKIWVGSTSVSVYPSVRAKFAILPTNNDNQKRPSCYIACYSRDPRYSVYGGPQFFKDNIFVMSQVSVPGCYVRKAWKSVCLPEGFENADISKERFFARLCEQKFPKACGGGKCWAGGETDWFGVGR